MEKIEVKHIGTVTIQGPTSYIKDQVKKLQLPVCADYGRCNCLKGYCEKGFGNG